MPESLLQLPYLTLVTPGESMCIREHLLRIPCSAHAEAVATWGKGVSTKEGQNHHRNARLKRNRQACRPW